MKNVGGKEAGANIPVRRGVPKPGRLKPARTRPARVVLRAWWDLNLHRFALDGCQDLDHCRKFGHRQKDDGSEDLSKFALEANFAPSSPSRHCEILPIDASLHQASMRSE